MKLFSVQLRPLYVRILSYDCQSYPRGPLPSFVHGAFAPSYNRPYSSTLDPKPNNLILFDYFIHSLNLPKTRALELCSHFPNVKSLEKPEAVVQFFKVLGLPDEQIKSIASYQPRILFMNVEKILKPKVAIFQELGLSGNNLGAFMLKNLNVFHSNVDKSLKPCISIFRKILKHDGSDTSDEKVNDKMIRIISRCNRILAMKSTVESNITYFESCGIVGAQLSNLLVRQPRIFGQRPEKVKEIMSRALDMGFVMYSRMLVHGVMIISQHTPANVEKKYDIIQSFGFSRSECTEMFRKFPYLMSISEAKIRRGMEFFLHKTKLDKLVIVNNPVCLSFSMEKRVIPRYRVVEVLMSKRLIEKEPYISKLLFLPTKEFTEEFILKFADYAEELMVAYEGSGLEPLKQ